MVINVREKIFLINVKFLRTDVTTFFNITAAFESSNHFLCEAPLTNTCTHSHLLCANYWVLIQDKNNETYTKYAVSFNTKKDFSSLFTIDLNLRNTCIG